MNESCDPQKCNREEHEAKLFDQKLRVFVSFVVNVRYCCGAAVVVTAVPRLYLSNQ